MIPTKKKNSPRGTLAILLVAIISISWWSENDSSRELSSRESFDTLSELAAPKFYPQRQVACRANAIVYMAQKSHSSYQGRNSMELLQKSLELLFDNYLAQNHENTTTVYIFHTGDFVDVDLQRLVPERHWALASESMHLVDLNNTKYWQLPDSVKNDDPNSWSQPDVYSVGYRHMIRWYAINLWTFFQEEVNLNAGCNVRYIMRMDEESFLWSKISYNLFAQMEGNQYQYGFRSCSYEMHHVDRLWGRYQQTSNVVPKRKFSGERLCGFYNNWFITDLKFWLRPDVQQYLHWVDGQGVIYRSRINDLVLQTSAVYAFMNSSRIHRFLDFTYEHMTHDQDGCPLWGVLAQGWRDADSNITELIMERFRGYVGKDCHISQAIPARYRVRVVNLEQQDMSPSYQRFPPETPKLPFPLTQLTAGLVDLPRQGVKSG